MLATITFLQRERGPHTYSSWKQPRAGWDRAGRQKHDKRKGPQKHFTLIKRRYFTHTFLKLGIWENKKYTSTKKREEQKVEVKYRALKCQLTIQGYIPPKRTESRMNKVSGRRLSEDAQEVRWREREHRRVHSTRQMFILVTAHSHPPTYQDECIFHKEHGLSSNDPKNAGALMLKLKTVESP